MACLSRFLEMWSKEQGEPTLDEKYLRNIIRNNWATEAITRKGEAEEEDAKPILSGWTEQRHESGFGFFQDPLTGKTTWIRPAVRGGQGGAPYSPPPPTKDGKLKMTSLVVRNRPCPPKEATMKFMGEE